MSKDKREDGDSHWLKLARHRKVFIGGPGSAPDEWRCAACHAPWPCPDAVDLKVR